MSSSDFVNDVRRVMGVPPWMLLVDSRETRLVVGNRCVQFKMNFYGPHAAKIEQDLDRLLAKGKLDSPTIYNPGANPDPKRKSTVGYRLLFLLACSTN